MACPCEGQPSLARLRSCFARGATVWLTGGEPGVQGEGQRLIHQLASLWNVVVTMGPLQYAESGHATACGYYPSTVTAIN